MSKRQHTPASAAVGIEHAIRMLEGRWKLVILFHLFGGRKLRFSDLERAIPAISQKMLIQQLRQLERDGIVARIVHAQVPPKVEYHLTRVGAVPVPGARQAPHVGGETALIPKWFAKCESHPPSARLACPNGISRLDHRWHGAGRSCGGACAGCRAVLRRSRDGQSQSDFSDRRSSLAAGDCGYGCGSVSGLRPRGSSGSMEDRFWRPTTHVESF